MAQNVYDDSLSLVQNDAQIEQNQSLSTTTTTSSGDVSSSSTQATTTPQLINVDIDNISSIPEKNNKYKRLLVGGLLLLLLLCIIVPAATVPSVILSKKSAQTSSNSGSTSITDTTTSIVTITQTTTTVTCASGYVRTPSGTCVNTQIDFNNCGSIGYVCASNYTSCSAGVCSARPPVQLAGAIAVPGWTNTTIDDAIVRVTLPVAITLYNYTTANVTVSSNGVLCLGTCSIFGGNSNLPTGSFGGPTAFGLWDDLMIYSGTAQTIYYGVSGTAPNRITTFEFYESHFTSSQRYYHFQIIFSENLPNIVKYSYFEMTDRGSGATIGVQRSSTGPNITYSVNLANAVAYNTTIVFDTNAGTFTG